MKRQLEQFKIRLSDLRRSEEREFVGGRDFRLDYRAIMDALLLPLTSRMVDLLRIASSVYFIDRLAMRDRKHGPNGWPRKIACTIEVRERDFWESSSVHAIVQEAVQFVSGDRWEFSFLPDNTASQIPNGGLFDAKQLFETTPVISLYSGGLDSAAGLACRLSTGIERPILPVIVRHRTDITNKASQQLNRFAKHFEVNLSPVSVVMSMIPPKRLVGHEELSQRARGFLFVAIGGVIAGATGSSELELYESGIGAVNVPLLAGMEGSQATRSAHPKFLNLMSRLLGLVADHRIDVTLPFLNSTKGEVVKSLGEDSLKEVVKSTISCAHFPVRLEKGGTWKSCGLCPACIFRRVALHAAGIEESSGGYQYDLFDADSCRLSSKKLRYLLAYLLQVDSLMELDESRLPLLIARHLISTQLLQPGNSQQPYVDLFRRYRSEWQCLLEHARRKGCDWARRIDLPDQAA